MRKIPLFALCLFLIGAAARAQTMQFIMDDNDAVGYLTLTINGSQCTGEFGLLWDSRGVRMNEIRAMTVCRYFRGGANNDYVEFNGPDRARQYFGWLSEDKSMAAGYSERAGQNHPWFAVDPDFLETVLADRMPASGYLVLANAAAGFLNLDRVTADNCEGSFNASYARDGTPLPDSALTNCKYYRGKDNNDYIEFNPGSQDIRYYAWLSENQDTMAGYFNVQGHDFPWMAVNPDFLEFAVNRFVSLDRTPDPQGRGYHANPIPDRGAVQQPPPHPGIPERGGNYSPAPAQATITNKATSRTYTDLLKAMDDLADGQTLAIGPGDVLISEPASLYRKNNITIQGAGRDRTRILVTSPQSVVLSVGEGNNITVRDLFLTHKVPPGQGCSAGVLETYGVTNLTVENNELVGSGVLGILLYDAGGTVRIVNNIIRDNQTHGIVMNPYGNSMSELIFEKNTIRDNGGYGVQCEEECAALAGARVTASGNTITGNARGDFKDLPASLEKALARSAGIPFKEPAPGPGGAVTPPPAPTSTAANLARAYGVDPAALAALIKQNDSVTVLAEYKDSPEMLALKLKHLAYMNDYRRKNGAGAIEFDIAVARLANYHAYDQALNNYMAHNSRDGSTPWDRAARFGISIWAENIASPGGVGTCDDFTPDIILDRMDSSSDMFMGEGPGGGHHDNMINPQHTGTGFGVMCYDGRVMYVEDFR